MFRTSSLLLVTLALLGTGCAEKPVMGVFGDEGGSRPSRTTPGVWVQRFGPVRGFRRCTVDPIDIRTAAGVELDPAVRQRIADQFRRELAVRLTGTYEVVDAPGAGVVRVTTIVTGVEPGAALGLAQARVDARVSDSVTAQPLMVLHDRRSHLRGAQNALFSEWEAAADVMRSWADAIAREIDRAVAPEPRRVP